MSRCSTVNLRLDLKLLVLYALGSVLVYPAQSMGDELDESYMGYYDVPDVSGDYFDVNLEGNYLTSVPASRFTDGQLPFLESLFLQYNVLESAPKLASSTLQMINLNHNLITSLDLGDFDGLPLLDHLQLVSNQIAHIHAPPIPHPSLAELDLTDNLLETVPDLSNWTMLAGVYLEDNFFVCNCSLSWILVTVQDIGIPGYAEPCVDPPGLRDVRLRDLEISDLQCPAPKVKANVTHNPNIRKVLAQKSYQIQGATVVKSTSGYSVLDCVRMCLEDDQCTSVNTTPTALGTGTEQLCDLLDDNPNTKDSSQPDTVNWRVIVPN